MKIKELFEENIPTYTGNITVPKDWKDLSGLPELYPGYTPGCKVTGNFYCNNCPSLTSLKGAPSSVGGYFNCSYCLALTSLEGAPSFVGGAFNCSNCTSLKSLKGAPSSVGSNFNCYKCPKLKSLEGAPSSVGGDFDCDSCQSLTSLVGAPNSIGDTFSCAFCPSLKSLEGIGEHYILSAIKFIANDTTPISSHVLGLLKVKNLKEVKFQNFKNTEVEEIINKYLTGNRNVWQCQDELQDLDLDEYAQL